MRRSVLPCLLAGIGALACAGTAAAAEREASRAPSGAFVPDQVLVRFKPGVDGRERARARSAQGARVERGLRVPRVQLLDIADDASVSEAIADFERDPRVEFAEPNYRAYARATPNDPLFANGTLWGLRNLGDLGGTAGADIDAVAAWDVTTGSANVTVAVVDTGIVPDHPDLAGRVLPGVDYVHDDGEPGDLDGHGTHVAGTIGAVGNNGLGSTGVAWDVRLLPLRVLDNNGTGTFADIADAFVDAGTQGVRIVNASLGGPGGETLEAAVAAASNTLFVVAAGNDGVNVDEEGFEDYPCSLEAVNVLCVAASDRTDARATFSNFGSVSVDLAAPGQAIQSTVPNPSLVWDELFDGGLGGWTEGTVVAGSDLDGDTPWDVSPDFKSQGTMGLGDSPANYTSNSNTYVRTTEAVEVGTDCDLWFDLRLHVGNTGDRFFVEASSSPTGPWTTLFSRNTDTRPDGSLDFMTFAADLHPFYESQAYLRFRFQTDGNGPPADGAAVDWVELFCHTGGDYTNGGYDSFNGTSMAAPHVSGAAALLLSRAPGLSTTQLKDTLVNTGDPVSWADKPIASGRRLNAARALQQVAGLSSSGGGGDDTAPAPAPQPAPPPPPATDSGTTDVTRLPQTDDEAPTVRASAARRYRVSTLLRRGLRSRVRCDEACRLRSDILVGRRTAKKLGIRGRRFGRSYILVGRARATLTRAGTKTVTTRVSRRARSGLRRARSVRLVLRTVATDGSRNSSVTRRRVTVRR